MKKLPTLLEGDESSKISSKRTIAVAIAITYMIVVLAHMFFGFTIDENIYDGLVNVLVWSLGFVGAEQLTGMMKKRYDVQSNVKKPNGESDEQP